MWRTVRRDPEYTAATQEREIARITAFVTLQGIVERAVAADDSGGSRP